MALDQNEWFTEVFQDEGTAFSLKIKQKLHEEQTPFQFLEIYETETFGNLMVLDGCVMLTQRDNFLYHEMMTHPALFSHPAPKDLVIIGGGDCGTLKEVLKHDSVQSVHQIDIDEAVTRASLRFFPELCARNSDPRATLLFDDGIKWIQSASDESLDLIIIDSTDPVGPAEGLFAVDFYRECARALRPEGIIVQQSESPLLHHKTIIQDIHNNLKAVGLSTVQTLPFPQPVYPTGWWSCTMAKAAGTFTDFRELTANEQGFTTKYYNAAIHRAALASPEFMRGL